MKKKTFFAIVMLCFVLACLMGCKANTPPETAPVPTSPYNLLDTMMTKTSNQTISAGKNEYTIPLELSEIKDLSGTFQGYLLATGVARNVVKVQLIDVTDATNPIVLRTSTFYAGTTFILRQYFAGTKAITIRIANMGNTQNIIQLKFQ